MRHLTLQQLSATVDQALSGVSLELVRRHLEECEECRARGSRLARVDGVVAQLVSHDPGDAWLEAVAIEIDERVCAEVAGRFDPPAHPAGPPPLEFAGAAPALSREELDRIWEEGSTTPRPSNVKPRETAAEPVSAAASEVIPAAPHVPPVTIVPTANDLPPIPHPAMKPVVVVRSAPVAKLAPLAKTTESKPVAPVAPVAKMSETKPPAPVEKTSETKPVAPLVRAAAAPRPVPPASPPAEPRAPVPVAKPAAGAVLPPAATRRIPPPRRRVPDEEPPMRWGQHADRVVRARREASSVQREAFLPIAFGLVGGALAGALVVTFFFLRHGGSGTAPAAPVVHSVSSPGPAGAIEDPVARPEIEPAPAPAQQKSEPVPVTSGAESATRPEAVATPRGSQPAAAAFPAPAKPRSVAPPSTAGAAAPRTTRARTESGGARAIPTGEEAWPLLCGEVVDESGAPVTGARILLADLDVGARTDRRGRFCLAAPPGDRTLSVVALGFATQRRAVSVANGAPDVRMVLKAAP